MNVKDGQENLKISNLELQFCTQYMHWNNELEIVQKQLTNFQLVAPTQNQLEIVQTRLTESEYLSDTESRTSRTAP